MYRFFSLYVDTAIQSPLFALLNTHSMVY